jgi:hypothetical protein
MNTCVTLSQSISHSVILLPPVLFPHYPCPASTSSTEGIIIAIIARAVARSRSSGDSLPSVGCDFRTRHVFSTVSRSRSRSWSFIFTNHNLLLLVVLSSEAHLVADCLRQVRVSLLRMLPKSEELIRCLLYVSGSSVVFLAICCIRDDQCIPILAAMLAVKKASRLKLRSEWKARLGKVSVKWYLSIKHAIVSPKYAL